MDISKKYIRMCEKAEEIQRKASLFPGDIWHHAEWGIGICHYNYPCWACDDGVEKVFWFDGYGIRLLSKLGNMTYLPRQDQLQEMIKPDYWQAWNYIGILSRFADKYITYLCSFDSMEQIWLALVMKEKFNKIWDEEKGDWISWTI